MAKAKKRKHVRIGGVRVSKRMQDAATAALRSPVAKIILAEALIQGAAMLASRTPTAAAAAVGAGTATAAADATGGARGAVANLLRFAADLLKGGSAAGARPQSDQGSENGVVSGVPVDANGGGVDQDTVGRSLIGEVLMGEFKAGKKAKKKNKHADRH